MADGRWPRAGSRSAPSVAMGVPGPAARPARQEHDAGDDEEEQPGESEVRATAVPRRVMMPHRADDQDQRDENGEQGEAERRAAAPLRSMLASPSLAREIGDERAKVAERLRRHALVETLLELLDRQPAGDMVLPQHLGGGVAVGIGGPDRIVLFVVPRVPFVVSHFHLLLLGSHRHTRRRYSMY